MQYIIGIIIILILLFFIGKHFIKIHTINKEIENANIELQNKNDFLKKETEKKYFELEKLDEKEQHYREKIRNVEEQYQSCVKHYAQRCSDQEDLSRESFSHYFDNLQNSYEEADKNFDKKIEVLNNKYKELEKEIDLKIKESQEDLRKIQATRAAAIQAQLKEKEIKENKNFYCLTIDETDKADIYRLTEIKKTLNKPRVLSMLIWSTWFQKPLKTLSNNVLGTTNDVSGIYKITNMVTEECYIGQSCAIARRWSEHAKCGLGIDTPANNKLYKAMQEYGLWNFSWELLEKCPAEQLNEKEKFYIELYQAYDYGYNSNTGVSKK